MSIDSPPSREERLYDLVELLTDRCHRSNHEELEQFLSSHAEFAGELRELLPLLQALAVVGSNPACLPPINATHQAPPNSLSDFRIEREIGRGGMGVVYEAVQISLGRRVALKVLPFAGIVDETQIKRFKNEAFAAAQLDHPHIVDVYGVGCDRGVHYYAMRFIDGRNVAEIRNGGHSPAPDESKTSVTANDGTMAGLDFDSGSDRQERYRKIASLGLQAAAALAHAHDQGVIHRDIKPSNLMLDVTGNTWVTDFGLARIETDPALTATGNVLGTLRYMSPEQASGKRVGVDHRTDIYSLGATLYELLVDRPVHGGANRKELLRQVLEEDPVPLRRHDPSIPRELATIIDQALRRDPRERYESAGDLAEDLRAFLEHRPISARPPSTWDHARKWCRRHRRLVASVCTLMFFVLGVSLTSIFLVHAERMKRVFEQQQREHLESLARLAEDRVEEHRYVTDIKRAEQAWQRCELEQMRTSLERWIPSKPGKDLRGFEWCYLWQALRQVTQGDVIRQLNAAGYYLAFSSDGSRLAIAGVDGVRVWNTRTREEEIHIDAHSGDVNWVSFSPDGQRLATASDDRWLRIWRTKNWQLDHSIGMIHYVVAAEFSPDGRMLAVAERGDPPDASGRVLEEYRLMLIDLDTWYARELRHDFRGNMQGLTFSRDSSHLAVASDDGRCAVFATATEKMVGKQHHAAALSCTAFGVRGERVVYGSRSGEICVADPAASNGGFLQVFQGHATDITSMSMSGDGKTLVTSSRDGMSRTWPIRADGSIVESPELTLRHDISLWCARQSPDGRQVYAIDAKGGVVCWDMLPTQHLKPRVVTTGQLTYGVIQFLGPGERFVTEERAVEIRDTHSENHVATLTSETTEQTRSAVAVHDKLVACLSNNGFLELWNSEDMQRLHRLEVPVSPLLEPFVSFSPDGQFVAITDGADCEMTLSIRTGRLFQPTEIRHRYGNWSPDGTYVIVRKSGQSKLLDARSGEVIPLVVDLCGYGWSSDGSRLASVQWDGTVHIWDSNSWEELISFLGAPDGGANVAFSPDGRTLAVAGARGEVRLWHVATGRELLVLPGKVSVSGAMRVSFAPNGRCLATTGQLEGEGHIWLHNLEGEFPPGLE